MDRCNEQGEVWRPGGRPETNRHIYVVEGDGSDNPQEGSHEDSHANDGGNPMRLPPLRYEHDCNVCQQQNYGNDHSNGRDVEERLVWGEQGTCRPRS
jgi:hypothetical protein